MTSTVSCAPNAVQEANRRRTTSRCSKQLRIVERFAVGFDDLPRPVPGRNDYRILIAAGVLILRFSVVGQLAPDGAVELVQLDIDHQTEWE